MSTIAIPCERRVVTMSRRSSERSADALEALATAAIGWMLYPSARRLIDYLDATDDDTIRADVGASAEALRDLGERILSFAGRPAGTDDSEHVARVAELERELEVAQTEHRAASESVERLEAELETAKSELSAATSEHNDTLAELQRQVAELQDSLSDVKEENHKLSLRNESYQAVLTERATATLEELEELGIEPDTKLTISGVIEMAREQLDRVQIHDAAPKEIEAMEADEKSGDWAREILRGLEALQAYAEEAEHFTGDFWVWCERSHHPSTWYASEKKLAMKESDTVRNSAKLWKLRRFNVSREVEPQGYKHMEAHLKISEGGGQHIPRLYFLDDTKGRTGNVHVGFIGPHRLVQNTNS